MSEVKGTKAKAVVDRGPSFEVKLWTFRPMTAEERERRHEETRRHVVRSARPAGSFAEAAEMIGSPPRLRSASLSSGAVTVTGTYDPFEFDVPILRKADGTPVNDLTGDLHDG